MSPSTRYKPRGGQVYVQIEAEKVKLSTVDGVYKKIVIPLT